MWFPSILRSRTGSFAPRRSKHPQHSPRSRRATPPLQVERLEQRWCPSYSLVTSRTALAGTDSVNWGTVGVDSTLLANPFTIVSTSGLSINVSKTVSDSFQIRQEDPVTPAPRDGWSGNFAPGDMLLYTNDLVSKTLNPITLDFGATAVAAGGAQIESDIDGKFTAKVEAFDANGNSLASFTEQGNATGAHDNSAIFIGISSTSATIHKIALSLTNAPMGTKGDFAINQFDFRTSALAAATTAAAPGVGQLASAVNLAPLASSLLGMGQPALQGEQLPGQTVPSTPPTSPSGGMPATDTAVAVHYEVADVVFAGSGGAVTGDNARLFASLSGQSMDGI